MVEQILEPRKKYLLQLKEEHRQYCDEYFENLRQKANIDEGANRATCDKIYAKEKEINLYTKKLKSSRVKSSIILIFSFFLLVIGIFAGIICIMVSQNEGQHFLFIGIASLVVAIGFFIFAIVHRIQSKKKEDRLNFLKKEAVKEYETLKEEAYAQLAPLNRLYEWDTVISLINKTVPLIELDVQADMQKIEMLEEKFHWDEGKGNNTSTELLQTGSILGNPFIIYRHRDMEMVSYPYTGSLTIHWTERVPTGKGGYTTVTRTQTLHATIRKPKPTYSSHTELVFGSEAAPDLTFSREPMIKDYSESGLKKFYNKREKEINNYAAKHPGFTPFGNDDFEDFFDGVNRDNEVQYRLLFTPLATKSMIDIITHKDPYGDDFYFIKKKMITSIISHHSQLFNYDSDPRYLHQFDLSKAKEHFMQVNQDFFCGLFFDLAPILSIPLYQQYPTNEYIFNRNQYKNFNSKAIEVEANHYVNSYFEPEENATDLIIKSDFMRKDGNADLVNIHAYGHKAIPHREYVSVMGGDGRYHSVPVDWMEYQPISKVTPFTVQSSKLTRSEFYQFTETKEYNDFVNNNVVSDGIICSKGVFSFLDKTSYSYRSKELNDRLNKLFDKKEGE
ncbi:MAG: hypothetical protein K6C32_00820 [Bacilli bacterium]|nr:hypothetical protein [Bacilli bacterium]